MNVKYFFIALSIVPGFLLQEKNASAEILEDQLELTEIPLLDWEPSEPTRYNPTPFDVSFLAYRGYFKDQGIGSYNRFCHQFRFGKIDGKIITRAAVTSGRLEESQADRSFENSVKQFSRQLCR